MLENNVQMKILKNKVLVDAILLVIQFCNLFVVNIMVYETTENNMFDWRLLFHNKGFKIWAFVFIGYNILIFYSEKGKEESENIKKAYEKSEINLLELVEKDAKNHDFSSVNETTKLIRELRKLKNGE